MTKPVTPLLAADALIELTDRPERPIVLIERKNPPYGWAIPGGFVDVGETVETTAVREALEEVSLQVNLRGLLGIYSSPTRDPRGHTVTAIYIAEATGTPVAADDASNVINYRHPWRLIMAWCWKITGVIGRPAKWRHYVLNELTKR